jgi:hypothetical protein
MTPSLKSYDMRWVNPVENLRFVGRFMLYELHNCPCLIRTVYQDLQILEVQ